jgi:hypothetical protein
MNNNTQNDDNNTQNDDNNTQNDDNNNQYINFNILIDIPPNLSFFPQPLLIRNTNSISQYSDFNIENNNYKSKLDVVKKSLSLTYEFVNKLKLMKQDVNINFIIINFDDMVDVYSTISLTNTNKESLINSVNICSFDEIKEVINKMYCRGGTNFYSIEQAFKFLRANIENFDDIRQVRYLMSDGQHNSTNIFPRNKLLNSDGLKFDYSLGIGNSKQYDRELLEKYGITFIEGIDEEEINNSIIGDTFGTVSLFANDVKISVFTTANEIKSNRNVISQELNVVFDSSVIVESCIENLNVSKISNNICKIFCNSSFDFDKINENLLFIFCVDISGSMGDVVTSSVPSDVSNINDQLKTIDDVTETINVDNVLVTTDKVENLEENISLKRPKISKSYNKFTLETINKFYMYSQEYVICDNTDPIYIEVEIKGHKYYYILNNEIVENRDETRGYEINLIDKYCYLMSRLYNVVKIKNQNDRKTELTSMRELSKSDDYHILYKLIVSKSEKSQLEIFYITTINQINKLFSQINTSHDSMFDNMLETANLSITRGVSAITSRQYSCPATYDIQYDEDLSLCGICVDCPREIIYDCGHCISCKDCTKTMFLNNLGFNITPSTRLTSSDINKSIVHIEKKDSFYQHILSESLSDNAMENKFNEILDSIEKNCPLCRKNVKKMKIFSRYDGSNSMLCTNSNCTNTAKYVSNNCNHLTYCDSCWNTYRRLNNNKLSCICGIEITSFIKIII